MLFFLPALYLSSAAQAKAIHGVLSRVEASGLRSYTDGAACVSWFYPCSIVFGIDILRQVLPFTSKPP